MCTAAAGRLRAALADYIANERTGFGVNAASALDDDGYEVLHAAVVALLSRVCSFGCGARVEVG